MKTDSARGGVIETGKHTRNSCFAAATLTNNRQGATGIESQGGIINGMNGLGGIEQACLVYGKIFAQMFGLKDGLGGKFLTGWR